MERVARDDLRGVKKMKIELSLMLKKRKGGGQVGWLRRSTVSHLGQHYSANFTSSQSSPTWLNTHVFPSSPDLSKLTCGETILSETGSSLRAKRIAWGKRVMGGSWQSPDSSLLTCKFAESRLTVNGNYEEMGNISLRIRLTAINSKQHSSPALTLTRSPTFPHIV